MKRIIFILILLFFPICLQAQSADHVVISEIKITGGTGKTTDEFVEIYNPTEQNIYLNGWSLYKQTLSGTEYVLVDNFGNLEIKSHGFLLVTHPTGYLGVVIPDLVYSTTSSISNDNSVYLKDSNGMVVDLVGMGVTSYFETEATVNPGSNKSIERKADINSDEDTMNEGEYDYGRGNSYDSDNNNLDFISKTIADPQNTISEIEYLDKVIISEEDSVSRISNLIIITELFPNPPGTDNEEFIEMYNADVEPINLLDWQVGDNSTNKFKITEENFNNTIINPGEYLVLEKELSGISLNNTTDAVFLYDYKGALVDSVEYLDCQEGQTYILIDGAWFWTEDISPGTLNKIYIDNAPPEAIFELEAEVLRVGQSIILDAGNSFDPDEDELEYIWEINNQEYSKKEIVEYFFDLAGEYQIKLTVIDKLGETDYQLASISVLDYDYSEKIAISEILSSCTGSDEECEFIEIYNNDDREINLIGWSITDTNKIFKFKQDTILDNGDYFVIKRSESKITLNNTGDKIYLIDPKEVIIYGVEYGESKSDCSFALDLGENKWQWTSTPTPGESNIFNEESVEIDAEMEENDLTPFNIAIQDITEEFIGCFLIVSGEVESAKKTGIYLMDETGHTIRVYIQEKTGIPWPDVEAGDFMQVTGLLDKTTAGLRLLPQKQEDIMITKSVQNVDDISDDPKVLGTAIDKKSIDVEQKDNSQEVSRYLYIAFGFIILIIIIFLIKYFFTKKQTSDPETEIY